MPGGLSERSGKSLASTHDTAQAESSRSGASALVLGTVQFGLDYGITNAQGRVPRDEVEAILAFAGRSGVRQLDTAALYGDSELVLGELAAAARFEIVTKTVKMSACRSASEAADALERGFDASLARLRTGSVDALLLHDVNDALGPHGDAVVKRLDALKADGRVRRVGASVYEGGEIDRLLARAQPDVVQLPINAVDRRLDAGGQLERLAARGVEVHARSAFLQGLLLQPPEAIADRFAPLRAAVRTLRARFAAEGLTVMEGLLASVAARPQIHRIVVGATSSREFAEIVCSAENVRMKAPSLDISEAAINDHRLLNPALWATL